MASPQKTALELVRAGDWDGAHRIVQDQSDTFSALIHAYLHRVEGDLGNATYWYRRADEPVRRDALETELDDLFRRLGERG